MYTKHEVICETRVEVMYFLCGWHLVWITMCIVVKYQFTRHLARSVLIRSYTARQAPRDVMKMDRGNREEI